MSIQLRGLHPLVRERAEIALEWANQNGVRPLVTSGFRSWTEQAALHEKFLRGESRFPANRPGDSAHNFGFAFDSALHDPRFAQARLDSWWKAVREAVGFEVPSNDEIHAQVPGWRRFRPA